MNNDRHGLCCTSALLGLLASASVFFSPLSFAALEVRDLDGNLGNGHEAVYDTVLDITWLADANLADSITFGVAGINSKGEMDWHAANNFIAAMNADNGGNGYLGVNNWRLSTTAPVNGTAFFEDPSDPYNDGGADRAYNIGAPVGPDNPYGKSENFLLAEMSYFYYNTLGGRPFQYGDGLVRDVKLGKSVSGADDATNTANLALFDNIEDRLYWLGTELDASNAFNFSMSHGSQRSTLKTNDDRYVWAVAQGDVTAVPVPAAGWLFSSAILAAYSLARKKSVSI